MFGCNPCLCFSTLRYWQVAQSELDRHRSVYEEERKRRESELRERHQVVQLRKQIKLQADRYSFHSPPPSRRGLLQVDDGTVL